jgi:hypothetical protein
LNSWDFILAGLRLAFPRSHSSNREGHAAEHAIIGSVLASFPPDSFSADGPFCSRLLTRIARSGLHPEGPPAAGFPCSQSPPTELRIGAARANVKGI